MPRESPRKRRKTNPSTLDDEDADALLRRFQRKPPAPPPAAGKPNSTIRSDSASSPHSLPASSFGSEEGELKQHNGTGGDRSTSEELGNASISPPPPRQSRVAVPRFGEETLRAMSGKRDSVAKDEDAGKASKFRSHSSKGLGPEKEKVKIQKKSSGNGDESKAVAKSASPRLLSSRSPGSGHSKDISKAQEHASISNGGSNDTTARAASSPRPGPSKESTNGQEKATSPNSEKKETRSTSRSRPEETAPSVRENGDVDKKIAATRRERDLLTVKSFWNDDAYNRYLDASPGTAELLAILAKQFKEKTARHYILNEVLLRMGKPNSGPGHTNISRGPEITCGDVRRARDNMKAKMKGLDDPQDLQPSKLDAELLRKFNLQVGASGLLEPARPVPKESTSEAPAVASPNLAFASPKEAKQPMPKETADSPLANTSISSPPPKREDPQSSFSLQSLRNQQVIDLTMDDPLPTKNDPPAVKSINPTGMIPPDLAYMFMDSSNTTRTTPAKNDPPAVKPINPTGMIPPDLAYMSMDSSNTTRRTIPAKNDPPAVTSTPKPKPKPTLPPASEIILIDSSNSTRVTTPVAANENLIANGKSDGNMKSDSKSDSNSIPKPNPETAVTNNSMRASTPLPTYTLMPRKKKRTLSVAEGSTSASSVKQTPTSMQPTDAHKPIEQQSVRQVSGDQQTSLSHNNLPPSTLSYGGHAPSVQQPNLQQSFDKQSPGVKAAPGVTQSPNVQHTPNKQPLTPTAAASATSTGPWKLYSREEDCLVVYLKTVFGASRSMLSAALPERTPGAINTRYCTKLKDGQIPLRAAIECLEKSAEFCHYLDPARHNAILNRLPVPSVASHPQPSAPPAIAMAHSSIPKPKPRYAASASLAFKNLSATEDDSSDQSHSAASGRERERRTRKAVNYNVKAYFSGTNIDHENGPSDSPAPPDQSATEGIKILPKVAKPQKSYKYAKPYLANHERKFLRQGLDAGTWEGKELSEWNGTSMHIGLSPQELAELENVVFDVFGLEHLEIINPRKRVEAIMKDTTEADIFEIAALASQRKTLPDRSKESVEAALRDAQDSCLDDSKLTLDDIQQTTPTLGSMVRRRELGSGAPNIRMNMKTKVYDTMGPSISFTGTSNDLNAVAWNPNGVQFAAGATCHVDYDSMQYNRPNNLLFGSMHDKSLQELPEHHTIREKPASGPNSQQAMHVTQDRRLFQTVASVCFSPDGSSMYSAGYDGMVRFWDVKESGASQRLKMWRNAKVDLLAVSKTGVLATAAQRTTSHAITVFDPEQPTDFDRWSISSFTSRKAAECPDNKIYPSTIRFDPYDGDRLLAGFASTSREDQLRGESCLWNLNTGTQVHLFPETRNVFDVAWNPTRLHAPEFAVGCVAGTNVNRGVRSVVKMYDPRSAERCSLTLELDCPALDMNDLMFCPFDDNYVVAGCTNGTTYVWDLRQTQPETCMYSLVHGSPLMELADPTSRERLDTGIRFCSWGHDRRRFYTGSSDGVVKSWDLYRAPDDAFVRDVVQLNSGVMCGSFNPDYSSLLLGEVNGSINVLEVGNDDRSIRDADSFDLISAPSHAKKSQTNGASEDADSGTAASKKLLESGQMVLAPMGGFPIRQALQGPNYAGPFDSAMDAEDLRDQAAAFQQRIASGGDEQCTIKGCNDVKTFTEEECGDSGRWKERIPAALTLWEDTSTKTASRQKETLAMVPKLKCSWPGCRRRAFLHLKDDVEVLSCETHHFGCVRCGEKCSFYRSSVGAQNLKDDPVLYLSFLHCGRYRADVLGFKRISDSWTYSLSELYKQIQERSEAGEEKPLSRRGRRLIYGSDSEDEDDNGIDEYYAGLWGMEEAPAAPPFLPQTPPPLSEARSSSSVPAYARPDSRAAVNNPSGKPSVARPSFASSHPVGRPNNGAQQDGGAVGGSGGSDAMVVQSPGQRGRRFVVDEDDDDADEGGAVVEPVPLDPQQQRQSSVARGLLTSASASASLLAPGNNGDVRSNERGGAAQTQGQEARPSREPVGDADAMDLDNDQPPATQTEHDELHHDDAPRNIHTADPIPDVPEKTDAEAPVPTVEGADDAANTAAAAAALNAPRRRSSAASSQKSATSSDSDKSRTPCVPM